VSIKFDQVKIKSVDSFIFKTRERGFRSRWQWLRYKW